MSKIGRKPINIGAAHVEVRGKDVYYTGAKTSGSYHVPDPFEVHVEGQQLFVAPKKEVEHALKRRELSREWGLHRALLANAITGSNTEFEKAVEITGLGFKASKSGKKLVFLLGYTHKIDFELPQNVSVAIDDTGQILKFTSPDKAALGLTCDRVCTLRRPEPYKGTGVKLASKRLIRKVSKGK